jgi:hypothetical protein
MLFYKISCNFRYASNSAAPTGVRGNTLEVYDLSLLKILWDFGASLSESALIKHGKYHNNKIKTMG